MGGDDEVDAGGAGELGEADDLLLYLDGGGHHEVGEFVEDEDPVGQFPFRAFGGVVGGDVAGADAFEASIAAFHFGDGDAEDADDFVGVGDDVGEGEVGNIAVFR